MVQVVQDPPQQRDREFVPGRLSVNMAAALIAYDGAVTNQLLVTIAQQLGITGNKNRTSGSQTKASAAVYWAMRPMRDAGLVRRDGDVWIVPDTAGLAKWMANLAANPYVHEGRTP